MSDMTRITPQQAVDLVSRFEGLRLDAYPDPGTGGKPWTVGYGHTEGVDENTHISAADATRLLALDLHNAGQHVEDCVHLDVVELNTNEFSALCSLVFNIGRTNFEQSTLVHMLNAGASRADVADQFLRWNHAGGKVMQGLTNRRTAERELFLKPMDESTDTQSSSDTELA